MNARSLTGCWTCRLRRKKCDERRPRCIKCEQLGIKCLEYGEKPKCMDGGFEEKKMVEGIKNAIKVAKIRKRLLHHSNTNTVQYMVYKTPLPVPQPQGVNTIQQQPIDMNVESGDSWTSDLSVVSIQIDDSRPFQSTPISVSPETRRSTAEIYELAGLKSFAIDEDPSIDSFLLTSPIETACFSLTEASRSCSFNPISDSNDSPSPPIEAEARPLQPASSFDAALDLILLPPSTIPTQTFPTDNSDFESAASIIYYLDYVLYIQFPFYRKVLSHGGIFRSWLVSLVTTLKPMYYTALALSSYFKDTLSFPSYDPRRFARYWKNHDRALIDLRYYIDHESGDVDYHLKISFCVLQLIFCEIFIGGNDWQMHFHVARSLITTLSSLKTLDQSASRSETIPSPTESTVSDNQDATRETAIDIVITTFTALEILFSASTRSPTRFQPPLQFPNTENQVPSPVTGCCPTVMSLLSQISLLETWKRDCEATETLSIMELSKRACSIESALEAFVAENDGNMQAALVSLKESGAAEGCLVNTTIPIPETSEKISHIISTLFALSAITYLHVVISGPIPYLKEIKRSVGKTTAIIKELPDKRLLRRAVWPFCVTGCLALGVSVEAELREAARAARVGKVEAEIGGLKQAFRVVEWCWGRREGSGGRFLDWTAAMAQLGIKILLF